MLDGWMDENYIVCFDKFEYFLRFSAFLVSSDYWYKMEDSGRKR